MQASAQQTVDDSAMSIIELKSKLDTSAKFNPFIKQNVNLPFDQQQLIDQLMSQTYMDPEQHDTNRYIPITEHSPPRAQQILDLQELARQKTAIDCFEMYAEIITVLKDLDPSLFKMAINIVKANFPSVELLPVSRLTKLYPEYVPDVF